MSKTFYPYHITLFNQLLVLLFPLFFKKEDNTISIGYIKPKVSIILISSELKSASSKETFNTPLLISFSFDFQIFIVCVNSDNSFSESVATINEHCFVLSACRHKFILSYLLFFSWVYYNTSFSPEEADTLALENDWSFLNNQIKNSIKKEYRKNFVIIKR